MNAPSALVEPRQRPAGVLGHVRVGVLEAKHFNVSNTAGDSGKTATINAAGMAALSPVYFDLAHCPYSERSKHRKALTRLFE